MANKPLTFNADETDMLIEALNMLNNSNKRMQASKPKFRAVFDKIETDITALKLKIQN